MCSTNTVTRKYRDMKARLCPQGGVANPRHGEAMAVAICTNEALPRSQIHHFHFVSILSGHSDRWSALSVLL
jgi:hypothetical protein